jgi:tetratricopeptide (TPR) repeat protein
MNDYVPNVAAIERSKSVLDQLQKHTEKESWDARRDRLRKELAAGGDYKVKNDLATALAHTGAAAEAVTLLQQIEAEKPGLYVTAANLGTVYELSGDDEKALEWIRKGIERNPESHEGTEWLHVRILEAKLALRDDPKWLELHSVLGSRSEDLMALIEPRDEKTHPFPGYGVSPSNSVTFSVVGNRGESLTLDQIKAALIYQLHERLQFVSPPDAIVGDLLASLGDLMGKEATGQGGAHGIYELASTYLERLPNVQPLQEAVHLNVMFSGMKQRLPNPQARVRRLWILAVAAIVLPFLVISLKRRIERRLTAKTAQEAA